MWSNFVTSFIIIYVYCIKTGSGDIVTHPNTSETQIGGLAYFNCSTTKTSDEIQWFHYPEENSARKLVYGFNSLHNGYRGFRIDRVDSTGSWNLVIPSVAIENAGKYECQDDIGRGDKGSANLIVLDSIELKSQITTTKVIGKNSCGLDPSQLVLTCNTRYHGHEAPIFEWRKIGDDQPINEGVTHETLPNNRVIYSLTMKGDTVKNGSTYACYAARSSSKTYYATDSLTVAADASDTCGSGLVAIVIVLIGVPLFNALTAGIIWYLFIHYQKKEFSEENPNIDDESAGLTNKQQQVTKENELTAPEKIEALPSRTESIKSTNKKKQKKSHGPKSKGNFSKDAIIFVLLMAIPCCIGLLLWYLIIYRRTLKNKKGQRDNEDELAGFLSQRQNTKNLEDKIKELEEKQLNLETENKISNENGKQYKDEAIGVTHDLQNNLHEARNKIKDLETTNITMTKTIENQKAQINEQSATIESLRSEKRQQESDVENTILKSIPLAVDQHHYSPGDPNSIGQRGEDGSMQDQRQAEKANKSRNLETRTSNMIKDLEVNQAQTTQQRDTAKMIYGPEVQPKGKIK